MFKKGIVIKHELEKAGFSEAEIARKAKVSRSYVSLIIYGKRKSTTPIGRKVKKIICKIMKSNPQDLWGNTEK